MWPALQTEFRLTPWYRPSYNLKQAADAPKRMMPDKSSCFDLVVSDMVIPLGFAVDVQPGLSDHSMVLFRSNLRRPDMRGTITTFHDFNHADRTSILGLV